MYSARHLPKRESHGIMKPVCLCGKSVNRFAQKGICHCTNTQSRKDQGPSSTRWNQLLLTNMQLVKGKCPGKSNLPAFAGNKWHSFAGFVRGTEAPGARGV